MINANLLIKLTPVISIEREDFESNHSYGRIWNRLKPHTYSLPKVFLNVGGKPILGHIIEKLLEEKINKATFNTGYLGEQIVEYVESNYPALKADFIQQEEMLGLGHAIQIAVPTFDAKTFSLFSAIQYLMSI